MAFDGIVTKSICTELNNLIGARIDKIFEPNKNTIIIGMYVNGHNYLLNICTDSQNCRLHLTTHPISNPQVAPNFCMVLRKNLLGLHLKNIFTMDLERLVIMEFEGLDDIDDIISKKLVVELMGKHSNIILLDEQQIIIDSLRHIKQDNIEFREVLPHTRYSFPTTEKVNFLEISSFDDFYAKLLKHNEIQENSFSLSSLISSTFNGISKTFIDAIINDLVPNYNTCDMQELMSPHFKTFLEKIYNKINHIISLLGSSSLCFKEFNSNKKDYYLSEDSSKINQPYKLNFYIDDFYYEKETSDNFKNVRNNLLKYILSILHKYDKRLLNIQNKLKECENMELYRLYGELITANLYKFNSNQKLQEITVFNYYDNSNISIPLDNKYSININAKRYFKKYNKLKNAFDIVGKQKEETNYELDYLQSIVYELENASTLEDVYEIFDEISENEIFQNLHCDKKLIDSFSIKKFKKTQLTKNKTVSFNPTKYVVDGYTVLVGRNNKENDILTLKYAHKYDIWFHVKDFHGSHVVLCLPDNNSITHISDNLLLSVAKIAVAHSKAKNSSNVPVDYCQICNVKRQNRQKTWYGILY